MIFRIGFGCDVHAYGTGNSIVLAGVTIPYEKGVIAHSDGDVIIHALCDALLGALALGDIGDHFPDSDAQYKNMSSMILLKHVYQLIRNDGWSLGNVDITLMAQAPKVAPYKQHMRAALAEALELHLHQISIKATTTEHLGFIGREEGIAANASILIQK